MAKTSSIPRHFHRSNRLPTQAPSSPLKPNGSSAPLIQNTGDDSDSDSDLDDVENHNPHHSNKTIATSSAIRPLRKARRSEMAPQPDSSLWIFDSRRLKGTQSASLMDSSVNLLGGVTAPWDMDGLDDGEDDDLGTDINQIEPIVPAKRSLPPDESSLSPPTSNLPPTKPSKMVQPGNFQRVAAAKESTTAVSQLKQHATVKVSHAVAIPDSRASSQHASASNTLLDHQPKQPYSAHPHRSSLAPHSENRPKPDPPPSAIKKHLTIHGLAPKSNKKARFASVESDFEHSPVLISSHGDAIHAVQPKTASLLNIPTASEPLSVPTTSTSILMSTPLEPASMPKGDKVIHPETVVQPNFSLTSDQRSMATLVASDHPLTARPQDRVARTEPPAGITRGKSTTPSSRDAPVEKGLPTHQEPSTVKSNNSHGPLTSFNRASIAKPSTAKSSSSVEPSSADATLTKPAAKSTNSSLKVTRTIPKSMVAAVGSQHGATSALSAVSIQSQLAVNLPQQSSTQESGDPRTNHQVDAVPRVKEPPPSVESSAASTSSEDPSVSKVSETIIDPPETRTPQRNLSGRSNPKPTNRVHVSELVGPRLSTLLELPTPNSTIEDVSKVTLNKHANESTDLSILSKTEGLPNCSTPYHTGPISLPMPPDTIHLSASRPKRSARRSSLGRSSPLKAPTIVPLKIFNRTAHPNNNQPTKEIASASSQPVYKVTLSSQEPHHQPTCLNKVSNLVQSPPSNNGNPGEEGRPADFHQKQTKQTQPSSTEVTPAIANNAQPTPLRYKQSELVLISAPGSAIAYNPHTSHEPTLRLTSVRKESSRSLVATSTGDLRTGPSSVPAKDTGKGAIPQPFEQAAAITSSDPASASLPSASVPVTRAHSMDTRRASRKVSRVAAEVQPQSRSSTSSTHPPISAKADLRKASRSILSTTSMKEGNIIGTLGPITSGVSPTHTRSDNSTKDRATSTAAATVIAAESEISASQTGGGSLQAVESEVASNTDIQPSNPLPTSHLQSRRLATVQNKPPQPRSQPPLTTGESGRRSASTQSSKSSRHGNNLTSAKRDQPPSKSRSEHPGEAVAANVAADAALVEGLSPRLDERSGQLGQSEAVSQVDLPCSAQLSTSDCREEPTPEIQNRPQDAKSQPLTPSLEVGASAAPTPPTNLEQNTKSLQSAVRDSRPKRRVSEDASRHSVEAGRPKPAIADPVAPFPSEEVGSHRGAEPEAVPKATTPITGHSSTSGHVANRLPEIQRDELRKLPLQTAMKQQTEPTRLTKNVPSRPERDLPLRKRVLKHVQPAPPSVNHGDRQTTRQPLQPQLNPPVPRPKPSATGNLSQNRGSTQPRHPSKETARRRKPEGSHQPDSNPRINAPVAPLAQAQEGSPRPSDTVDVAHLTHMNTDIVTSESLNDATIRTSRPFTSPGQSKRKRQDRMSVDAHPIPQSATHSPNPDLSISRGSAEGETQESRKRRREVTQSNKATTTDMHRELGTEDEELRAQDRPVVKVIDLISPMAKQPPADKFVLYLETPLDTHSSGPPVPSAYEDETGSTQAVPLHSTHKHTNSEDQLRLTRHAQNRVQRVEPLPQPLLTLPKEFVFTVRSGAENTVRIKDRRDQAVNIGRGSRTVSQQTSGKASVRSADPSREKTQTRVREDTVAATHDRATKRTRIDPTIVSRPQPAVARATRHKPPLAQKGIGATNRVRVAISRLNKLSETASQPAVNIKKASKRPLLSSHRPMDGPSRSAVTSVGTSARPPPQTSSSRTQAVPDPADHAATMRSRLLQEIREKNLNISRDSRPTETSAPMIPRSAREKGKQRAVESDERAPQPHQVMTGASAVGSLNLSISEGHQQRGTYTGDRQRPLSSTLRKVSGESDVPVQGSSANGTGHHPSLGKPRPVSSLGFQKCLNQWREVEARQVQQSHLVGSSLRPKQTEWQDVSLVHHVLPVRELKTKAMMPDFGLATQKRVREREAWEQAKRAKERYENELRLQEEMMTREQEREEWLQMRRERVVKANPVPDYLRRAAP